MSTALRTPAVDRGPAPHRLTVDDVWAMVKAGVIEEGAKVELFDGELYDMPADGPLNLDWASWIGAWLFRDLGDAYRIVPGMTLKLSDFYGPKPDWWVSPWTIPAAEVRGPDVLLAIEQSDTTLAFDLGWNAGLYARHGVRDYWAVDLKNRRVLIHRDPSEGGYPPPQVMEAEQTAEALLILGLRLRLKDLPRAG